MPQHEFPALYQMGKVRKMASDCFPSQKLRQMAFYCAKGDLSMHTQN